MAGTAPPRASERRQLRREYEVKVQSGEWPAQETNVPLFPYQREGMLHLAFTERALLADEMGLGKTIQAIAACALLHRLGQARRVLVVTPASLKTEWEEQIRRFTTLNYQLVFGGKVRRLKVYNPARTTAVFHHCQLRADGGRRAGCERAAGAGHRGAGRGAADQKLEHQDRAGGQAAPQPVCVCPHRHADREPH